MNKTGIRSFFSTGWVVSLALLLLAGAAFSDEKPKAVAKPAAKSGSSAKPAAGTSKSSGPTTTSHGPTTTSHGPTTTSGHTTTTTSAHSTTTSTTHTTTTTPKGGSQPAKPGASAAKGTAAPKGSTVTATKTGGTVTKRADGKVATLHDPKRGMDVHHGLNGNRRVVVERADHSRVVAERGGHGFVEHPYRFHGRDYARRSYYYHGRYYHAYYGRYYYHGVYMYPYYPAYYYGPAYYGWVYNPWVAPVAYGWGWAGNPWYGYYGSWFTPYPVYASASLWLTDYIIGNSLAAAYQAQAAQAQAAAMGDAAPLTPEAKQLIADEVKRQVAIEYDQAKAGGSDTATDPAANSIQRELTDGGRHVFVAGQDLDVTDSAGNECALSEGDALQLAGPTAPDATAASLTVLASKGGKECAKGGTVSVQLQDLQEMQNHMRQTIDEGMQELQKKQGQGGLPAAPAAAKSAPVESAMAAGAPPPPPEKEVAAEINQESKEADQAEKEAGGDAGAAAAPVQTTNIGIGSTIEEVEAAMGQPLTKADAGKKKIYVYKDMKITFMDGKVSDVQ